MCKHYSFSPFQLSSKKLMFYLSYNNILIYTINQTYKNIIRIVLSNWNNFDTGCFVLTYTHFFATNGFNW